MELTGANIGQTFWLAGSERNCFQKSNLSQVIMIWKLGNPTALLVLFVIISHHSEMVLTKSLNHFGSHISVTSTKNF